MINFFIVIIVSLFAFWPVFSASFLQFDDPQHVMANPAVIASLPGSLQHIFTQSVNKIYLPLSTLSFALEKQFFGFNPFIFHLDNVLLHFAVMIILFFLLKRWGLKPRVAMLTILIFAIHPMKVESVAWVTERKDVLYALFYTLSLFTYTRYVQKRSYGSYGTAVLFALLSILSKPMALSLPLILCLLDWYLRRGFNFKTALDKIPFVIIVGGIGWITYAQNIRNPINDAGTSMLIWIWSCSFYVWKFFFPLNVYAFYKLPQPVTLYSWEYGLSVAFFFLLILCLLLWRHRRMFVLAGGYFLFSIFFLLRFDIGADSSVVNDRFMYLPGLGFCILLGILFHDLCRSRMGRVFITILIVSLAMKTHQQCRVWQNTLSFYNEVIHTYPDAFTGYNNRAHLYYSAGQLPLALADYNKAIELSPNFARNYIGRGTIYGMLNDHLKAIEDFSTAVRIDPVLAEGYFNRSIAENALELYQASLDDAEHSLKLGIPVPAAFLEALRAKTK